MPKKLICKIIKQKNRIYYNNCKDSEHNYKQLKLNYKQLWELNLIQLE